jgi:hypothetical protein
MTTVHWSAVFRLVGVIVVVLDTMDQFCTPPKCGSDPGVPGDTQGVIMCD